MFAPRPGREGTINSPSTISIFWSMRSHFQGMSSMSISKISKLASPRTGAR